MSSNILFISETLFKERTGASTAIDGKQIFPMIKVAQDMYIQPTLGSTFYKRLQMGIDAGNLTNDEKLVIDDYITDSLVWYTMSLLPFAMGYQLFSKGFLQKTAEESTTPSHKDLELISSQYKSMAEFYNTRMIWYLQENYNKYFEYLNPGSGADVIFPETRAYSCGIFLGDYIGKPSPRYVNSTSINITPLVAYFTTTGGEASFTVNELMGKEPFFASRGGLSKGITKFATANTSYIQIVNGLVTLPTGDIAMPGELFTFLYR